MIRAATDGKYAKEVGPPEQVNHLRYSRWQKHPCEPEYRHWMLPPARSAGGRYYPHTDGRTFMMNVSLISRQLDIIFSGRALPSLKRQLWGRRFRARWYKLAQTCWSEAVVASTSPEWAAPRLSVRWRDSIRRQRWRWALARGKYRAAWCSSSWRSGYSEPSRWWWWRWFRRHWRCWTRRLKMEMLEILTISLMEDMKRAFTDATKGLDDEDSMK